MNNIENRILRNWANHSSTYNKVQQLGKGFYITTKQLGLAATSGITINNKELHSWLTLYFLDSTLRPFRAEVEINNQYGEDERGEHLRIPFGQYFADKPESYQSCAYLFYLVEQRALTKWALFSAFSLKNVHQDSLLYANSLLCHKQRYSCGIPINKRSIYIHNISVGAEILCSSLNPLFVFLRFFNEITSKQLKSTYAVSELWWDGKCWKKGVHSTTRMPSISALFLHFFLIIV